MAFYEHVFIARQDVAPQLVEQMTNEFVELVKAQGGKVTKTESWGLRNLAYIIKKNRKGHYVLLNIEAEAAAVQELERTQSLHEDILRFLTVRVDALEEGTSVVMRRDDRRESRGSRGGNSAQDRGDRGYRPRKNTATDYEGDA